MGRRDHFGMSRAIPRRDFLPGLAATIGAVGAGGPVGGGRVGGRGNVALRLGPAGATLERGRGESRETRQDSVRFEVPSRLMKSGLRKL